jgi:hypothetical protein
MDEGVSKKSAWHLFLTRLTSKVRSHMKSPCVVKAIFDENGAKYFCRFLPKQNCQALAFPKPKL